MIAYGVETIANDAVKSNKNNSTSFCSGTMVCQRRVSNRIIRHQICRGKKYDSPPVIVLASLQKRYLDGRISPYRQLATIPGDSRLPQATTHHENWKFPATEKNLVRAYQHLFFFSSPQKHDSKPAK